jgi:hypothetical protein
MDELIKNIAHSTSTALHINAAVVIRQNEVKRNGKVIFTSEEQNLAGFLGDLHQFTGAKYQRFYKMDALSKLGWLAAELLLDQDYKANGYEPAKQGIILSNANSSLDTDIRYQESMAAIPSPAIFVYTLPNIVIGEIAIRHGIKGENAFFIFEQFNADFIEQYVSVLLNNNILQACVCGWVDVLAEQYDAALFLVEKTGREGARPFTAGIMNQIYQ